MISDGAPDWKSRLTPSFATSVMGKNIIIIIILLANQKNFFKKYKIEQKGTGFSKTSAAERAASTAPRLETATEYF